jgi:SAM-dependent methyltransferase
MSEADTHRQYEVERELANRLRAAKDRTARRALYPVVYTDRIDLVPSHPLAQRAASVDRQREEVRRQFGLVKPFLRRETRFLELGPGDCALAVEVARHVAKVTAVDVSDALYDHLEQQANFELLLGDGVTVPVPSSSFDVAFSSQVLEHLHPEDALDHVREVARALAPGGVFVCVTPNRLAGPWDVSRHYDRVATGLHLREYTLTELRRLLREGGFSDVRCFISARGRHLSPVLGSSWLRPLEAMIEPIPFALRRRVAGALGAFKIVAQKSNAAV